MQILKSFLMNLSVLVTFTYLFNLAFKYIFQNASSQVKQTALIIIFIISGWLSIIFALKGQSFTLFDLRAVPIIFGTLVFRNPRHLLVIGSGIAVGRLVIADITPQAITGSINVLILGCLGALLVQFYQRNALSYTSKALVSVFSIITTQSICIAAFGALPTEYYLTGVFPYTYPAGVLVSLFFVFIINDFYKEQLRAADIRNKNQILYRQTRDLRRTKRELEEKANQLMQSSKYKSEFIANMSHELKTPLNSIILLSQLLLENNEDQDRDQESRYAELIHTSGQELLKIIEDILDLSKVEAGKMDIIFERTSTEDLIEMVQQEFEPMTSVKGLLFEISTASDVPVVLTTDVFRLRQILRNLLMNAIKFTEKGKVGLSVDIDRSAGSEGSSQNIVFTVYDTGIGISSDKQQFIFEAFQQEDGAINRKYGGTGLGLSISLQLAKLLGGALSLQSKRGEGSRFSLHLPLHPVEHVYTD
ncbi:sensor histidine kinase [Cohnella sp.]|uniref:sensor histidine kinase n=1 Tax=Cohnella sp. TaxID=1883426 RepID=UPI0035663A95